VSLTLTIIALLSLTALIFFVAQTIITSLHIVLQNVSQKIDSTEMFFIFFAPIAQSQRSGKYFNKAQYRFAVQECDANEA
jgi:hypothetical protein